MRFDSPERTLSEQVEDTLESLQEMIKEMAQMIEFLRAMAKLPRSC